MGAAIGWGALASSSLVFGALLGLARPWPKTWVGSVLAFGAGALISAVSFELAQEGAKVGGPGTVAAGLAAGALTYFLAYGAVAQMGSRSTGAERSPAGDGGTALALGAFLDGIPEQAVLGISIAGGEGVSVGLLVAIFVSNLPEAIGSARSRPLPGTRSPTHPAMTSRRRSTASRLALCS
jgi:ZIP family zinc transporter